jgi:hypothetical protein
MTLTTGTLKLLFRLARDGARGTRDSTFSIVCAAYTYNKSIYSARRLSTHEDDRRKVVHTCAESCEAHEGDLRPVQLFRHRTPTRGEQTRRQHIMARFQVTKTP